MLKPVTGGYYSNCMRWGKGTVCGPGLPACLPVMGSLDVCYGQKRCTSANAGVHY